MPGAIKETATEQSSFKISVVFKDESGNSVEPETMAWTLTDIGGSVINNLVDQTIENPSSEESILLKGDDLAVDGNVKTKRIITFEGTYNSTEFGDDLPLKDESVFTIIPITII